MKKNETNQNYLEAIYFISLEKGKVKAIDVANYLGFSRPTVSIALKELVKEGYVVMDGFDVNLTENGKKVAKEMAERHEYIARLLIHFGVDEDTAYEDSCLIEHDLSAESFAAIKNATKHLKL
ncbi:MAG: metal-dependent transcriptional regulator [Erysipelotrichaceae bacterium]|nr:metal-dependent transcriptional regulator [Erysipelotrichaceae bacterium]